MKPASSFAAPPDHPRSRGEYDIILDIPVNEAGSSPLSRGIPSSAGMFFTRIGIIPALAGNTRSRGNWNLVAADHPRSRGEYFETSFMKSRMCGSSPLSRGILNGIASALQGNGIIPALAENTSPWFLTFRLFGDHPRSRGEYYRRENSPEPPEGSSPLSRGIP